MAQQGGDWFTDNAPSTVAPAQASQTDYGSPVLNRIAGYFRSAGIQPTYAQVTAWGGNIDQAYEQKIRQHILAGAQSSASATAPTAGKGDYAAFGQAWMASGGKTPADLAAFAKAHPEYGAEVFGSKGDKVKIGGKEFDAVYAAGSGGLGATWNELGGDGGAAQTGGTLLDPWTAQFQYPSFEPPPAFQAPTSDEAFNDQGFQFTLQQGRDALEKSASARGTLLTTGTLKDLDQFSQGLGSQQYDKVYGRKIGEYESRYGHATTDYQNDYNKTLGEYQQGYNIWNANEDRPFNKLTTLAGLGAGASSQMLGAGGTYSGLYGNTLMNNAATLGNLGIQGANANAGANMYGSQAYQNAYGNLGNLGALYAGLYQRQLQQPGPWASGYVYGR